MDNDDDFLVGGATDHCWSVDLSGLLRPCVDCSRFRFLLFLAKQKKKWRREEHEIEGWRRMG